MQLYFKAYFANFRTPRPPDNYCTVPYVHTARFNAFFICKLLCFLYLLFYGEFNPAKPRVNLQGKHLMLLFTLILPCF